MTLKNLLFKIGLVTILSVQQNAYSQEKGNELASASLLNLNSALHTSVSVPRLPQNENFTPIVFSPGSKVSGISLSGKACLQKIGEAGKANVSNKKIAWKSMYKMTAGCALINACSPTLIEMGPTTIYVHENTAAVLHIENDVARIANIADHKRYSLRVLFANHYIDLDPGTEIVFVKSSNPNAKQVAIQESIGWKDMQHVKDNGFHIFTFRVSAKDMIKTCKIYKQLNQSPLACDHDLRDDIIKTVAALEEMYNKHKGPYNLSDPYLYGPDGKPQLAKSKDKSA